MTTLTFQQRSIVVADPLLENVLKLASRAAKSRHPVFICGETGTGKELIARYLHESSDRSRKPFISVNCAALPEGLVEAELFGYERGAFTGANTQKPGKFELASEGTLLLDEVSEMPITLQAKLLRVLQEGEIDRLGGRHPIPVQTRVVATSNQEPQELIRAGLFRGDLYFRLNVIRLDCPPLRGRSEAILGLARVFLEKLSEGNQAYVLSDRAEKKLLAHCWPGNIRELKNSLERSVVLADGTVIDDCHLELTDGLLTPEPKSESLADMEEAHIREVLQQTQGNREMAAKKLGITSRTLRNKLRVYASSEE